MGPSPGVTSDTRVAIWGEAEVKHKDKCPERLIYAWVKCRAGQSR